ncbi:nesprin-2 [Pyxicephalus adspersus]|uniref:nesprin-2 n=1 Tax=Pyxicephalus adspersus TaxID=30357 RepID=UPI003B5CA679
MSSDSGSSLSAGEDQQLAIDQRQQVLQAEQEGTQKRTFSNWINSQLSKHQQKSVVKDLYIDIQDGHILLDLLEVMSGEVLPREKGKNIFQSRSNVESALTFLGKRSIKLINIHVEDIISGKPSIVLGLIWQIILHFHIEGLASILAGNDDLQPVTSDTKKEASPTASPSPKRSAKSRWKISAKKVLLQWAQEQCARVGSINVTDFKSSWKNGQAFLAIIHSLRPDLVDMEKFQVQSNEEKLKEAFRIAEEELKIPRLLEPEDVNVSDPDEKSIMTYVAQFLQYSKNKAEPTRDKTDRVWKAMEWLNSEEQTLKKLFSEMKDETYTKKYQEILLFMRRFNEQKRIYMSDLAMESLQSEEQRLIKQLLENITFQIAAWKEQLDQSLPPPLDNIESWLSEVENLMSQTLPESGSHHNAMSLLQALSVSHQNLMINAAGHSESLRSFKNVDDNGVILVPADKMEEMKTRLEKILTANFIVLVDYRLSGHYVLALLEDGRPKLKSWKGKYKSQEAVESLLADYNEFVGEKQFMFHLENAFQKFKELHTQLLTTEEYSDDPEIAKQYEVIKSKYETFVSSAQEAKPILEKVLTCWIQFENNISLITAWMDEQHKIHPAQVPAEILSKWKSVHKSLNRDAHFLMERTKEKAASRLSHRMKSLNNRWAKYLKLYEGQKNVGNGSQVKENLSDVTDGESAKQTEVSTGTLRSQIKAIQTSTRSTAESVQACTDILSHLEKLEKLNESINIWTGGAEQLFTTANLQNPLEDSVLGNIQEFYEDGISHQEQLAESEMTIQAVSHLILSHEDLHNFNIDGLKRNLVQAHEKVQELVSRLGFVLHPPEKHLTDKDIKINFERSKQDLETYITSAVTLLGEKLTPEEFISQYEKSVGKFSIQNLETFLKAAEQMRTISSDKEKLAVDEIRADLRHRWKVVRDELESYVSALKQLQKQRFDHQSCKPKTKILEAVHQNGGRIPEKTKGPTLYKQLQIYEAQKKDLEHVLQRSREILDAKSLQEAQDVNELQSRRQELQALQAQLNKNWKRLESTSCAVEKLMKGDEKINCTETRSALQSGIKAVTEEINNRIQSLSTTINVLLPIEQEVSVLCESNLQTPVQDMEKFTISSIGSVCQDLQEFQSSVKDQIQQCDILETASEIVDPASPVDAQAVQSIVQQYKIQLEATSEATKEREALLNDLETFFSSLETTKWSIQIVAAVNDTDRTVILQKRRNIELLENKVRNLRIKAKKLDDHLVPTGIYLEDPEHGRELTCQMLVDRFFEKIEMAKQAVLQELSNLDTQDSAIQSLNGALKSHLPSDDDVTSGIIDQYEEQKMEAFTASKIDSVLQEIKEVQNTFENEIQQCDSLALSGTEPSLHQYKQEMQATNEVIRKREATLKALKDFLSSVKAAKASMETESTILVMDRETLLQKQRKLEELEKDIYCLGQVAEKLDDDLQSSEIILEDPEHGGVTSCQKMISVFFDKLENAQQAVQRDLQSLQEREVLEKLNSRQRALCKHIEDIQDQVDKLGLRDPTIHAVQQRMKSLAQLEKKLETFMNEKISISDGFLALSQTARSVDFGGSEQCEMLWEDAMQNITHSKEQCEVVIELLRRFQSYKKDLASLIQKAETIMTGQSSYMGKENLQKTMKKVKAVKREFDDHSEDVDEISSICKKLQSQIKQIKSFEESPFQTEANAIIDKWLDITEKLENYNENLNSAISLWNKILHLSEDIERWSEYRKNVFETPELTRKNILQLNVEAENQEKHLEEISKLSRGIQNLLQINELPLELQDVSAEFVQKKINQDALDSLREVAKVKALEERVKVTEEQREAIGQPQMRLDDCDSNRRQLETSLSDSPAGGNDSLPDSALLTTVEERLHPAEVLSDDGGRVVISNEVQTQDIQPVGEQFIPPSSREAESALEDPLPQFTQFQQQMHEILFNISPIGGDHTVTQKTLEKLTSHVKLFCATPESEQSPERLHMAALDRNITSCKKHPLTLTMTELKKQIEDIEKLHNDILQIRSQESAVQKAKDGDSRGSELLLAKCEDLLNELTTLRTWKKTLCQALKSFQDALCAARLSYQMLCKEKENLKMVPTESHISQLDKISYFLDKVEKEKCNLHALKAAQANIGQLEISSRDKDRMDTEVSHIEDLWEQIEFSVHREHNRLTKEDEELAALKNKVDDIQSIIHLQQNLLDQPSPSQENALNASLGLFADIQAIKHGFNLLRNTCDVQMKRTWGGKERQDLENSLDDLQNELENLEERIKDQQLTRCQTPDAFLEQCPPLKPLYSSLLWMKKCQGKSSSEKGIALLPGNVEQQTTTYKKVHKEILERKSAVDSAIGESEHISVSFDGAMSKDFSSFLQQLQELYKELIIQSTSRLQQLEIGQEKRKALFSEIEKLKKLLQGLEKEATPVKRGIFTATELCEQLNCLKAKTTEMEEIEGLVLTLLRNSQSYHSELKCSEQLYLNDILRSLKSKARRIRRLEEKTFCYTEKLLSICNKFQERLTSLHRNLNALQPIEPKMHEEALERDREVFEKKLQLSQNAVSSSEDHLSVILRYKDLFKDNRLHWDDLPIDDLQNNCLSLTEGSGHSEHCGPEQEHYQELLEKIRTMVGSLQKEYDSLTISFDIIAAQVLCKKIKKISVLIVEVMRCLHSEQAVSMDSLKAEEQSLNALAKNMNRSYQALSQLVNDYYGRQKHSQHQVKQTLCTLKRIDRELQEPFSIELDENNLQERLLRLEALDEITKSEVQGVSLVPSLPSADDFREHLQEIENTGQQIEKRLSEHIITTKEAYNILQNMQKAIKKVAELFRQNEETLQGGPFALSCLGSKTKVLDSKDEELNITIAEIQNIVGQLQSVCSTEDQKDLDDILNLINNKKHELAGLRERKQSLLASNEEKYQLFKTQKQKILKELEEMEVAIGDSFLQKPASYKAALEQWEKSKNLTSKIQSYEEELLELQRILRDLRTSNDDDVLLGRVMSSLWDRWLYLLGITRDLELYCDELKQEWKLISELLEREVILLDNCQEEVLDKPDIRQKTSHLQNLLGEIERFEENIQMQQLQLFLLKHRIQNILGTPEPDPESVPVVKEIQSMEAKCEGLLHTGQKYMQQIEAELQERERLNDDISAVNKSALEISSRLENMEITDVAYLKTSLEELLQLVGSEKEKAQVVMEKLQDRYAETIPEELQSHAEQCQDYLRETEKKVGNEIEQCSPQGIMARKVNEITAGLKNIEAQLQIKTENIFQAKEIQKKVWDEVDGWHSKLHALESEVQDMAEEDPSLAQEWMDKLTEPFHYHQQVTSLAERRTANLNKAASKLEEYEDTLRSTKLWIQNTDGLINEERKDCSAKVLNKYFNALMIALDDSESKQFTLDTISNELEELTVICETDKIVESLDEVRSQVKDLQQRIFNVLPQIQHLANEVASIENEVKKMEKRVGSIRTILTSSDIDEMSPKEHHKNGQVIQENIKSIRETIADIEAYRPSLLFYASGVQSLCVFRRMRRLLREAEVLEKVIKEQNTLLEPIISKMLELEQEQEKLKHISKNFALETEIKDKAEELRKRMDEINQGKEAVLLSQRSLVIEQLVRLQQEPEDQDLEALLSPVTEGVDNVNNEIHWTDPYVLPSLVEEVEESSFISEAVDNVPVVSEAVDCNKKAKEDASHSFISPVSLDQMTQEQQENAAAASGSVKPEMILRDCQGKVTEVELWLQRLNLSLEESKLEPDMLQSLEQKLVDFQKTLQETETKINSLLEGVDTRKQGPGSILEEAESLSKKLKALKVSLETVQTMLQAKPTGEQVKSTETADKKHPTEKLVPIQDIVATSQIRNAGEVVSSQTRPKGKLYPAEDITWSKWQYLQKELSHRTKAAPSSPENEPDAEKDLRINFISRFPGRTLTQLPPGDSKQLLTRLQTLSEEEAAPLPQESGIHLHSALFVWLCSVSQWVQKVEKTLDTDISREEVSLKLEYYEKLSEDLKSLSEEMRKKMDSLLKLISHEGENVGVLSQCYNDIRNWLVQTHGVLLSRTKRMREELKKQNSYQNDVRQLYDMLIRKKTVLQQLGGREASELFKESADYETELHTIENQLSVLSEKGEKMSIPISSNQEIHKLQDVLDETWQILRVKQDEYSSAVIAKSQVDSLLRGVTDLVSLGKEKILKSTDFKCTSKEALTSHYQEFKNFFNILDSHVLLLQALASKSSTPANCKQIAETALHEADILSKEADTHCVHMMGIMKEWDKFNSRYDDLHKKMEALESLLPTKNLVEESEERVNERLRQYQQIKALLDENEAGLNCVAISGKKLQPLLRCRDLDSQVLRLERQWSQLTQKVGHELHRLESLGNHLASYNRTSTELSAWLKSAYQKLNFYKAQSLDVSQDLDTIKGNLRKFFEFTLEVDEKSCLKTSVLITGTQLLRLKEADPKMLKLSLAKYKEQWTGLISALPPIQEKLQQLLMEKLPSLQATQEVMEWMRNAEHETVPTTMSDIRGLLQKYKSLQKEMSHKQCIVDFVNQSLLQLSVGDVEGKRYERAELAERLGTLNLQWNMMQGDINRKIQHMEQTLESISDQESRRQSVNNWFDAQQVRLNKLQRPSSLTAAESILAECLELEEQIKAKSNALEELERSGVPAGDHSVFQKGALTSENLLKKRDALASQVADLKTSIHSLLTHWKIYNENYECVTKMLVKLLYVLGQAQRPVSSLNCLRHQLKILQSAQEEAEQHQDNWSKIRAALKSMEGLCSPSVFAILEQDCKKAGSRWTSANEELSSRLQSSGLLLQLWEAYTVSHHNHTLDMEQLERKCQQLLYAEVSEDRQADTLQQRIQDLQVLEQSLHTLRAHNLQVSELANKVIQQNAAAADVIHSERQNTSHRIDHLERSVSSKTAELKLIQKEVEAFKNDLENLQSSVKSADDFVGHVCLSQQEKDERSEIVKKHLLELRELTADIERLNEETFILPLDDRSLMSLQNLNRSWEKTGEMALEDCREHRVNELDRNSFIQNYETWMQCVEKMENNLTMSIAGTFEELKKQQEMYEKMQAEIAINEHILPSFVNKALSVLESEEEEHRNEVLLKLTSLKEKWQSVISLVQQRNREITVLLKQWWQFKVSKQRLEKSLSGVQAALSSVNPQKCHSLINAEKLLDDFKEKERHLQRLQPIFNTTVEYGKDLLSVAESKEALQCDLTQLQDSWQNTMLQLQAVLTHLTDTALKRETFNQNVEEKRKSLHSLKARVDAPLPTLHEDLQRYRLTVKELEEALDEWGDSLKELDNMKAELSQYIIAEDGVVLKKQVEALQSQWEELCLRVSVRKQEIEDRLNAWNVFNEKNKELCDWLTQMESKVLQTADVNIEEMIEKLQKDCMEEINLFSENKLHLKQIGDQLILASNKARSTDIENKLNKVNDRWKHLFDVIGSRVKKLKETLVIIQQLDKNMSNLRTWLARIESELSKPVIYSICDDQEINKKLEEQRDLQKDIELHSAGVASVLNICERLLHDTDACANETECDSIQQTTRSLDKRWRNICTMSMERRLRIEETWRLWQKFLEDYSKFDDWLKEAEAMAASPDSSDVLYTRAKEEQKKFEVCICRGHKSDIEEKMQQLIGFKQEITLNTNKIDQLIVFGEQLIQKSEAMDAVVIEDELEEIHRYCQEVFGRVYRFHERLTSKGLRLEEERETSENDTDGEDSREIQNSSWHSTIPEVDTSHQSLCHLMPPPLPHERSGRETPVSVDSIPLEWDPTVDVGGSSMHENDEESPYYNPLSDVEIAESPEAYVIMTTKTVQASSGKSDLETPSWHSPDKRIAAVKPEYKLDENSEDLRSATEGTKASLDESFNEQSPTSTPSGGTDARISDTADEQLDDNGLRGIFSPGTHSGVIERWEIIQAQSLSNELSAKQNLQQWQQFNSDLDNISLWLEKTEAELDNAEKLKPSTSIQELKHKVKKFRDTLKAFDHYKALVLSANLSSKEFQQDDNEESRNLLRRLHEVNSRWDQACHRRDKWRESLQNDLNQCEEFHETSHQLLLWLTEAESRRLKYQAANHKGDPHALLECQRQLMQLKEQLLEKQIQAKSLQDMSSYLLGSNAEGGYIEANERAHVIATKIRQLLKEVSRDLKTVQRALVSNTGDRPITLFLHLAPFCCCSVAVGASRASRQKKPPATVRETSKKQSFFYRVLRAALPLQLLLLLLLLLACMIPFSEEDYSCAQANNFARSFYPMLRYTNGPPPT